MRRLLIPLMVLPLVLTGCTAAPTPDPTPSAAVVRFTTGDPAAPALIDAASAPERAVQASRAFFAAAPGVIVAPDGDRAAQERAAAAAARLHVPVLLAPAAPTGSPSPAPGGVLAAEVRRLGARWAAVAGDPTVRLPGVRRLALAAAPAVRAPEGRGGVAIAARTSADTAALATARAAGAEVVALPDGSADLNASGKAVEALAAAKADRVALIGSAFARGGDPAWAVAAARTGWQYPGGGQRPFTGRLSVALYGTPGEPALGVLGRQGSAATIARVRALAKQYEPLVEEPVAPVLEVIASVASGSPTDDGDYSSERSIDALEPLVVAAAAAGIPVILDLQPGRTDFLTQAKRYSRLLERPNVGLALDPEWRLGPTQKPLVRIGGVGAAEVNRTSAWLAQLVRAKGLPPKPFVLHQFRLTMLRDRSRIVVDRPELQVLIHVDGQGGQPDKQATWRAVRAGAPDVAWGWKNFLRTDHPVLTPAQTIQRVHPTPDLITYQ